MVFGFGLLHGLGFAGVLTEFGLTPTHFVSGLIGFNVGVEAASLPSSQPAMRCSAPGFPTRAGTAPASPMPMSLAIGCMAIWWVAETHRPHCLRDEI